LDNIIPEVVHDLQETMFSVTNKLNTPKAKASETPHITKTAKHQVISTDILNSIRNRL